MRAMLAMLTGTLLALPGGAWAAEGLILAQTSRDELFGTTPSPAQPAESAPPAGAPGSRDDLFGTTPAAPADQDQPTRDGLFGLDAPKEPSRGIRWSGFYNGQLAYTHSHPGHWSRAVNRLQLEGRGELAPGVRYKISARADVDPLYYETNFYPDRVQDDQDFNFFLRENYLDFAVGDWDLRVGRQHIIWGEVVGLFFADVVSARDTRDFILPSFDIMRIPQWAARAEYFGDNWHAELVWIPYQSYDEIGKPGAEFYPAGLIADDIPGAVFASDDRPARNIGNSAWGVRMNTLINGWDLAGFYYRSHSAAPTFHREIAVVNGVPTAILTPRHEQIWQVGSTISKDFGSFVLRGEAVYTDGQAYTVDDLNDPDGVVKRNSFDYILGFDISMPADTSLNVQVFHRHIFGDSDDIVPKTDGFGASVLISHKITSQWEPQLLWIQSLSHGGDRMLRPRLNWYVTQNTTVAFGVDIFAGPDDGFFGRYNNRDRIYTELRYDF